jgi:hypothetical protein
VKLRDEIRSVAADLGRKNAQYTHDEVISELRKKRPDLKRTASRYLENMALRRILNDIEGKQSKSFNFAQTEMFPELSGMPLSVPSGIGYPRGHRRFLQRMSVKEVREHLLATKHPRVPVVKISKIERFIADAEASGCVTSENMSLEDVVARVREKVGASEPLA